MKKFALYAFDIELQILIEACRVSFEPHRKDILEKFIQQQQFSWDRLTDLAKIHSIRPLLLRGVSQLDNSLVNALFIENLKAECRQVALRGLLNTQELLRILGLLNDHNIIAIPYKGVYLANDIYRDFGLREASDIDLLIYENDLFRVKDILMSVGYTPEYDLSESKLKAHLRINCEYNFNYHDKQGVRYHIEPHYKTNHQFFCVDLNLNDFEEKIVQTNFQNQTISTLKPEGMALLLLTNHGFNEAWASLKYIYDFHLFFVKYKDKIDWLWLHQNTKSRDLDNSLLTGLGLCAILFDTPLPDSVQKNILDNTIQALIKDRLNSLKHFTGVGFLSQWDKWMFNVKSRATLSTKLRVLYFKVRPITVFRTYILKIKTGVN